LKQRIETTVHRLAASQKVEPQKPTVLMQQLVKNAKRVIVYLKHLTIQFTEL